MRSESRDVLLADTAVVLLTLVVLGAMCGGVWALLTPAASGPSPEGVSELDLARRFAADGWYSVIAIVGGFLSGVGLAWWRSRDLRVTTTLLVVGSGLAAVVMVLVGGVLEGGRLAVSSFPVYLMWPVSVLAGALMVLWSSPGVPPLPHRRTQETTNTAGSDHLA